MKTKITILSNLQSGVRVVTLASSAPAPEKQKGEVMEAEDNHDMLVDDFDLEQVGKSL